MTRASVSKAANPYMPIPAPLVEVIDETPTIKTFVIEPAEPIPFRAGQFVELTLPAADRLTLWDDIQPLEPGVVITVEPGIYFQDRGWGIRIEDMVLVKKNGFEVLTKVPKDLTILH